MTGAGQFHPTLARLKRISDFQRRNRNSFGQGRSDDNAARGRGLDNNFTGKPAIA